MELLARVGNFLRIVSQMMEEVGYMAEQIARGHRPALGEEEDVTNLVQGIKDVNQQPLADVLQ